MKKELCRDSDAVVVPKEAAVSRKRHLDDEDEYIEHLWQDIRELDELYVTFAFLNALSQPHSSPRDSSRKSKLANIPATSSFLPFRNQTIEKWSNKVQVASGVTLNKKFKAFDQVSLYRTP